jgi:hypothetical protein
LRRRNCEPGQHHCKAKARGHEKVFILIVHLSPPCVICPILGYMGFNRRQGKRSSRFGDFWAFSALYANFAGDACGWGDCWYCKAQFCNCSRGIGLPNSVALPVAAAKFLHDSAAPHRFQFPQLWCQE